MKKSILVLLTVTPVWFTTIFAEETNKFSIEVETDVVSRFVWRGVDYGQSPSIQPSVTFLYGSFDFMLWGAYATNNNNMQEVDWYLTYNLGDLFSLTLCDYFLMDNNLINNRYFMYRHDKTSHINELVFDYHGTKRFPLRLMAASVIYGDDKVSAYIKTDSDKLNYSSYVEIGYPFSAGDIIVDSFLGVNTHTGMYGDDLAIVNVGLTATKEIVLSATYSIPFSCSFILNPAQENVFVVAGIRL